VDRLASIAVDLTPVLPGGENGGAKLLAMELVRRLAAAHPATRFTLLTQAATHDELAPLETPNVRRVMVVGPQASAGRARLASGSARVLAALPTPMRRAAARAGHAAHRRMQRAAARGPMRGERFDLLFCPFTAPTYRMHGTPAVCTLYDLQYRAHPELFAVEDAAQRAGAFAAACRHAAAIAPISDFSRAAAVAAGADPSRTRTIQPRLARSAAGTRDPGLLARLGLAAGRYLIYPANFWRHKNHEMLLAAFAMARASGLADDVRLVCTGSPGARQAWIREASHRAGLGESVVLPGYVTPGELDALVADAGALVFPSLYEGFGLPVIDAMASGVPVACADGTGLAETAGGAALLFDPRTPDAIAGATLAIMSDADLRARLVAAGARRGAEFADGARMADEYWQLFLDARGNAQ
jgi:glycosyltransferase involved in cell wall biosynthesis